MRGAMWDSPGFIISNEVVFVAERTMYVKSHAYICMCTYLHMYVNVCVCVYVCVSMHVRIHTYIHLYVHAYWL